MLRIATAFIPGSMGCSSRIFPYRLSNVVCRFCKSESPPVTEICVDVSPPADKTDTAKPIPPLPKSFDGTFFNGPVPLDKILRRYSKSSGAGGQHVQKTSSKVTLSFEVDAALWLPQWIRERLHMMYGKRINKKGEIMVSCETGRNQMSNEREACRMLMEMIHAASEDPEDPYKETVKKAKQEKQRSKRKQASSARHRKIREERLAKFAEAAEIAKNWKPGSGGA